MDKKIQKIITCLIILMINLLFAVNLISVNAKDASGEVQLLHELDPTSNFFTQVEDTTQVEIVDKRPA